MSILYMILGSASDCLSGVFKKFHKKPCNMFFAFVACLSISLLFLITGGFKFEMDSGLWIYCILYGVLYGISATCSTTAFKTGDLTLTSLFICFSGMLPPLYSIIFHGTTVGLTFWLGLFFFVLSLIFINLKTADFKSKKTKKPINLVWVLTLIASVLSYGGAMVVMGEQKLAYLGQKENELMILGGLIASLICLGCSLVTERGKIKDGIIGTVLLGGSMGVFAGLYNLFYMLLLASVAVTLIAPTLLVGSLIMAFLIGLFAYKEKYDLLQYVGLLLGVVSVVLLNV